MSKGDLKVDISKEERKTIQTTFLLLFPSVIVAGIAAYYAPVFISLLGVALAVYQFLMIKRFVQDFYER